MNGLTKKASILIGAALCVIGGLGQPTSDTPPIPPSPVQQFRTWLGESATQREQALAKFPEARRKVLNAKLREYEKLAPLERERRLKALEMHHYLRPLMALRPAERQEKLAAVPPQFRNIVQARLKQWDALDEGTKREALENEFATQVFSRVPLAQTVQANISLRNGPDQPPVPAAEFVSARQERTRQYQQFVRFFELPPGQQQKTLKSLPEAERKEMELTLKSFSELSSEQRKVCVESFTKFSSMSAEERDLFLKSAEQWQSMSPEDRATWKTIVTKLLPPLPLELPPMPPLELQMPPMPE